jgi:hypothetical protein
MGITPRGFASGFRILSAVEGRWHPSIDGCQRGEITKMDHIEK